MKANKFAKASVKAARLTSAMFSLAWSAALVYVYVKDVEKKTKQIGKIITA